MKWNNYIGTKFKLVKASKEEYLDQLGVSHIGSKVIDCTIVQVTNQENFDAYEKNGGLVIIAYDDQSRQFKSSSTGAEMSLWNYWSETGDSYRPREGSWQKYSEHKHYFYGNNNNPERFVWHEYDDDNHS